MPFKKSLLLLGIFVVAGCGFSAVHGEKARQAVQSFPGIKLETKTALITPNASGILTEQRFDKYFNEAVNPDSDIKKENYLLTTVITIQQSPIAIQQDSRITRFNMVISAEYQLFTIDRTLIQKGRIRRDGSFDATSASQYATFSAELDAQNRILRELANDMSHEILSIVMDRRSGKKQNKS